MDTYTRHFLVSVVVFTAALLVGTTAFAQQEGEDELSEGEVQEQAESDEGDMSRAQEAFDRGARHYYAEEYSDAIVEFRRANEIQAHPIFQHNIALSNRAMGRTDRALDWALTADENADEMPPETATTNTGVITGSRVAIKAAEVFNSLDTDAEVEAPGQTSEPMLGMAGWSGVVSAIVGGAMLGGAGIIDLQLRGAEEELRGIEDDQEFNDRKTSFQSQQTTGLVLLFSGAGLAVVGGSLIAFDMLTGGSDSGSEEPAEGDVAVAPSLHRPGVEMMIRW